MLEQAVSIRTSLKNMVEHAFLKHHEVERLEF